MYVVLKERSRIPSKRKEKKGRMEKEGRCSFKDPRPSNLLLLFLFLSRQLICFIPIFPKKRSFQSTLNSERSK